MAGAVRSYFFRLLIGEKKLLGVLLNGVQPQSERYYQRYYGSYYTKLGKK